jgi:vancomycin resistance protein YoaR
MPDATSSGFGHRRTVTLVAIGTVLVVGVLAGGLTTMAWGDGLRQQERLLPGTSVHGVDVGDHTVQAAVSAVRDSVAVDLARTVEVRDGERTWRTSADALGTTTDLEQVVATAFERTLQADLFDLARVRLGAGTLQAHDVTLQVPDEALDTLVAEMAAEVDTPPQDATLAWVDGSARVGASVTGRHVDRARAAAAVEAALIGDTPDLVLPVVDDPPAFSTTDAQQVADRVTAAVQAAMDHRVTVTVADSGRSVTPRELGATHNADDLLAARGDGTVELTVPGDAVHGVVDDLAAVEEVAARNAQLAWTAGGGFRATPGHTGLRLDHDAAQVALHDALQGAGDRVALELHTTQPDLTTDDFGEVLLVRQSDRRVDLYRGGHVVRSWSVAVGTSGHPTPTGLFTIGAKRFEPTWHNSSPDGWGEDMPETIGPGPDNPLGLRALNWMQHGLDTLIRFHGTANVTSIGRAASHGCVRMTNADVIELFDLVDTGTVILSVA